MVEERKVLAERHSFKVLAIFAVALTLQGTSLAVFQGDRPANNAEWRSERSALMAGGVMATDVFTVTTVNDDGPGSLRQAIADANANPGLDEIVFDFHEPVTITLSSPLIITDPVSVESHGSHITDTIPGWLTLDGSNLSSSMLVISSTNQTSFRRLRLVNVNDGFGFQIVGGLGATEIISSAIQNSSGAVQLQNSGNITLTHNVFVGMSEIGVQAMGGEGLWMQENKLRNIGGTAVSLLDGLKNSVIISNSINGVFGEEFSAAMVVSGDPAPTGIVLRGNHFTDTFSPISLGPGANNGFPAPEIMNAFAPITGTQTVNFSLRSTADPFTYTYPLLMDLYRVRDGNYTPLGTNVMYDASAFPNHITYTSPIPTNSVLPNDKLAVIATTSNPSSSEFSDPVPLVPPPDDDGDGVADGDDLCPGTVIPEANVPSIRLGVNRFALVDGDTEFDTTEPEGVGPGRSYTTAETGGCSCEQIIDELGLGRGHSRFGCSISAMDDWVAGIGSVDKTDAAQAASAPETFALEQNYPNPFNPATTIVFQVPEQRHVVVRVFDMLGRAVTTLVNEEMDQGIYHVEWDGRGANGHPVTSGVYIYQIEAGDFSSARTMILHR